jgi:hypothetical protein
MLHANILKLKDNLTSRGAKVERPDRSDVARVKSCKLAVGAQRWAWANARAADIAAHWRHAVTAKPAYFNGPVLILMHHEIGHGDFAGTFAATDFASFIYWRAMGHPERNVWDCFGCAVLRSADGDMILGVQAGGNLNAGLAYFPSGFIDAADVRADGTIDIDGSVARELTEETGLAVGSFIRSPGYVLAMTTASIAIGIEFRSQLNSAQLRKQILDHIARERSPELVDVRIVRTPADIEGVATTPHVAPLVRALMS